MACGFDGLAGLANVMFGLGLGVDGKRWGLKRQIRVDKSKFEGGCGCGGRFKAWGMEVTQAKRNKLNHSASAAYATCSLPAAA